MNMMSDYIVQDKHSGEVFEVNSIEEANKEFEISKDYYEEFTGDERICIYKLVKSASVVQDTDRKDEPKEQGYDSWVKWQDSQHDSLLAELQESQKTIRDSTRIIARNLVAWDTSKDKRQGLLPEVYLANRHWYKKLTGEEYFQHKAVKKFDIE
jgi:hypothetical protein